MPPEPTAPAASPPLPQAHDPRPATPDREITLEEWIAAGQGCCGRDDGARD